MTRGTQVGTVALLPVLVALGWCGRAAATDPDPDPERDAPAAGAPTEPPPPPAPAAPAEGGGERAGPPVDLFPEDRLGAAVGWELRPEPAPSPGEAESEEELDRWLDEQIRHDRIGAGDVDGWYHGLGRSMRTAFRPDVHAVLSDLTRGQDVFERAVTELGRHAAPPQRPIDPGGVSPSTLFARSREDEHVQETFDQMSPLHTPITWHRVGVRVTHTRAGIARVEVTRSSGSETLDRAATEAVRAGAAASPELPDTVVGERDTVVSEWTFEMGDVATRLGQVAGVEGPEGDGIQAGVLGRGVIRTSVSLVRVIDARHPPIEERRIRRRSGEP